jgi:small subunit ribosomal protein S15
MALTSEQKQEIIKKYGATEKDTGSAQSQIALLSKRIRELTEHLKDHPKDYACRRGLLMLVGKRRRLLNYFKKNATAEQYKELISALKIRK